MNIYFRPQPRRRAPAALGGPCDCTCTAARRARHPTPSADTTHTLHTELGRPVIKEPRESHKTSQGQALSIRPRPPPRDGGGAARLRRTQGRRRGDIHTNAITLNTIYIYIYILTDDLWCMNSKIFSARSIAGRLLVVALSGTATRDRGDRGPSCVDPWANTCACSIDIAGPPARAASR